MSHASPAHRSGSASSGRLPCSSESTCRPIPLPSLCVTDAFGAVWFLSAIVHVGGHTEGTVCASVYKVPEAAEWLLLREPPKGSAVRMAQAAVALGEGCAPSPGTSTKLNTDFCTEAWYRQPVHQSPVREHLELSGE